MQSFTNYYEVLGIAQDASEQEIKKAFRALAKIYHPDISTDPQASRRFIAIEQAYNVLSDSQKRAVFDALLTPGTARTTRVERETTSAGGQKGEEAADKQREDAPFIFPSFVAGAPARFVLQGRSYHLTAAFVSSLERDGMLAGMADGQEYLLLYCVSCHALFGTTQMRDSSGQLYHPYDIFPVCPHCREIEWCPADEAREARARGAEMEDEVREEREKDAETERERQARARLAAFRRQQMRASSGEAGQQQQHETRPTHVASRRVSSSIPLNSWEISGLISVVGLIIILFGKILFDAYSSGHLTGLASSVDPTATVYALTSLNPDPSFKMLTYYSSMTSNTGTWDSGSSTSEGSCSFGDDGYSILLNTRQVDNNNAGFPPDCQLHSESFSDFSLSLQLKVVSGDCGVVNLEGTHSINFTINICKNGNYAISGSTTANSTKGSSEAIQQGDGQTNTIGLIVRGATLTLLINKQKVASITGTEISDVWIALSTTVGKDSSHIVYSNLAIWTL